MATDKSNDIVQLRTPEVQELIGHIPGGFMRYGIGLILALLIAVLCVCNYIPYSDEQTLSMRVLPNVQTVSIYSPCEGSINRCYVKEGSHVDIGDTLLTIRTNETLHTLKAPESGYVEFCSFCVSNECVRKGQPLFELYEQQVSPRPLQAIADTLPRSVTDDQLRSIDVRLNGRFVPFKLVKIIEDKVTGHKQALFQSESCTKVIQQTKVSGIVTIHEGVLLDKLIQIRRK